VLQRMGQSGRRDVSVSDADIHMVLSEVAGAGVNCRAEKDILGGAQ